MRSGRGRGGRRVDELKGGTWGWTFMDAPETGDNAADTSPLTVSVLIFISASSYFYWHKSLNKGTGSIISPPSLWSPPHSTPDAVHLPASACWQPILTWGVQVSGHASVSRVPNDTSGTFQDHERENLSQWYMEHVDSVKLIFMGGRIHIPSTSMHSFSMCSYCDNKSKVQIRVLSFTDGRDAWSSL